MSDDGRHALTLILFVGSVFSPWYFRGRNSGRSRPEEHPAMNVALYGVGRGRWAMSEYSSAALRRGPDHLQIGPNSARWRGDCLEVSFCERAAPIPRAVRGRVRLHPQSLPGWSTPLDAAGRHRWQPVAPLARVEVRLEEPSLSWCGSGYLDSNTGSEPLEEAFREWTWARAHLDGMAAVTYDVTPLRGAATSLALTFARDGTVGRIEGLERRALPGTHWRIARQARVEQASAGALPGAAPRVLHTLEDAPFYARSIIQTRLLRQSVLAFHETLSLERFRRAWVRTLLPFRMRRARS